MLVAENLHKTYRRHAVQVRVLNGLNLVLLREAARRDRVAAAALAPYVVWTGFATALNASIWRRNR